MSRPEPRLITKILSLAAVRSAGITAVYPLKVPQGAAYPGVVYQVIEDMPFDDNMGRTAGHKCKIRLSCLAREATGVPGYQAARAIASAIEGDSNPTGIPSGIAGWRDTERNVWSKENSFDEMGTIISGADEFDAYVINLIFTTAYSVLSS